MRVIAGSARRLLLKTPAGMETRPTADRIKETLFNILQPELYGCRFLDLFAGSGGIGIEALSRGAAYAVFVDSANTAISCINENLQSTRLNDKALVLPGDCIAMIHRLSAQGDSFDIIFMDPPYHADVENDVLHALSSSSLVTEDTTIIIEAALDKELPDITQYGFCIERIKEYKTNKHFFLKKF